MQSQLEKCRLRQEKANFQKNDDWEEIYLKKVTHKKRNGSHSASPK